MMRAPAPSKMKDQLQCPCLSLLRARQRVDLHAVRAGQRDGRALRGAHALGAAHLRAAHAHVGHRKCERARLSGGRAPCNCNCSS